MKQVKLSFTAGRTLISHLENKGEGYSLKQLLQLEKLINDLQKDIQFKTYKEDFDLLVKKFRKEVVLQSLTQAEADLLMAEQVEQLEQAHADQQLTVILDLDDYQFLLQNWQESANFYGVENIRKIVLEIDTALKDALIVDTTDFKQSSL